MHAPVARPAGFVLLVAEGELLTVADRRDAARLDPLADEVVLHRLRQICTEAEVVLDRPAAVSVSLELHLGAAVLAQPGDVLRQHVAGGAVQLGAVVGEADVAEHAALLGTEPALGALEARAGGTQPRLAQAFPAGTTFTRMGSLLRGAPAAQRDEQEERQQHAPGHLPSPTDDHPHLASPHRALRAP